MIKINELLLLFLYNTSTQPLPALSLYLPTFSLQLNAHHCHNISISNASNCIESHRHQQHLSTSPACRDTASCQLCMTAATAGLQCKPMCDTQPGTSPSRVLAGSNSLPRCSARCQLSEKPSKRVSPSSGGQLQCAATCNEAPLPSCILIKCSGRCPSRGRNHLCWHHGHDGATGG